MTKKTPTELNPERSEKHRIWENFRFLPLLIILCSVTLIAAAISWIASDRTGELAIAADIRSTSIEKRFETELQRMALEFERELRRSDERWTIEYNELKTEERVLQNKVDRYEANLHALEDN